MKSLYISVVFMITISICCLGQVPQSVNYQAVARNASGAILPNHTLTVRLTIHNNTMNGAVSYTQTDTVTTNAQGLFTLVIGNATGIPGGFGNINWSSGSKFLQIEMDANAGTNFLDMGTSQLLSVPFALEADALSPAATVSPTQLLQYGAATGQALKWSGSTWTPMSDARIAPVIAYDHTYVDLTSSLGHTIILLTINAPAAGTVLLNAQYDLTCLTCSNAQDAADYTIFITNSSTALYTSLSNVSGGRVIGPSGGNSGDTPIVRGSVQRVMSVVAGANTFYLRGTQNTGTNTVRVLRPSFTALFVPN